MKLKLVMGAVQKQYEIGNSPFAAQAINAYERYCQAQNHEGIFAVNQALWSLLSGRHKKNICDAISDYSAYKLTVEEDVFERFYFASVACNCYEQAALTVPSENMQALQFAVIAQQQYIDANPNLAMERMLAAGIAVGEAEISQDEKTNTEADLLNYTKKFLSKHAADLAGSTWKPYPKEQINIPGMKEDDLRFIKMGLDKAGVAEKFTNKLKDHGFWAQKQETKTGVFVTTNLTRSTPSFKK